MDGVSACSAKVGVCAEEPGCVRHLNMGGSERKRSEMGGAEAAEVGRALQGV